MSESANWRFFLGVILLVINAPLLSTRSWSEKIPIHQQENVYRAQAASSDILTACLSLPSISFKTVNGVEMAVSDFSVNVHSVELLPPLVVQFKRLFSIILQASSCCRSFKIIPKQSAYCCGRGASSSCNSVCISK